MSKTKHWIFTINNPSDTDLPPAESYTYLIFGREKGEDGTPHYQGYVAFINRKMLKTVKKLLPRAHLEIMEGTSLEASEYCKKDGDYVEYGILPVSNTIRKKRDWDEAFKLAIAGKMHEIPKNLLIPYYHAFKRIQQDHPPILQELASIGGLWIWGPTGVGKSSMARRLYPNYYPKPLNKWWDCYTGQENIIIDELSPEQANLGWASRLKIWTDHYPFIAQNKGGSIYIRPKNIIITSNYSINEVFLMDPLAASAISRRFKSIHLTKKTQQALDYEREKFIGTVPRENSIFSDTDLDEQQTQTKSSTPPTQTYEEYEHSQTGCNKGPCNL